MKSTLYARSNTGAILEWTIETLGDSFRTIAGQRGGSLVTSEWTTCFIKNEGKANETSGEEQAEKEAEAKIKKKKKEGYTESAQDIDTAAFKEPMLAKQYEDYRDDLTFPVGVEDKLNGIRSNHRMDKSLSRRGEQFHNIEHIREELDSLFEKFPDLFLDGELFNYEKRNLLSDIAELVAVTRQPKDITPELRAKSRDIVKLYVYDGYGFTINGNAITTETKFWQRKQALKKLLAGMKYVSVLDYHFAKTPEDVEKALKYSASMGWEGIIVRALDAPYEHKRSKYLLKYKNFVDEEFEVVDILQGKGNWFGHAKKIVCKLNVPSTRGETTFESGIRGTKPQMKELFENKHRYIGKAATVEFQEYSKYKVPLIPYTQLPFRDYE